MKRYILASLGIQNNRPIVKYKVDNSLNYKIGFVNWLGGVNNGQF